LDGCWGMEMLFQDEKLVLPGSEVLKHEIRDLRGHEKGVAEPFITNQFLGDMTNFLAISYLHIIPALYIYKEILRIS